MNALTENILSLLPPTVSSEVSSIIHGLHFLRPEWFFAFIPLAAYLLYLLKKPLDQGQWLTVVDKNLAPFVLTQGTQRRRRLTWLLTLLGASLCIFAVAGPVYKKLPQPVFREQSSLVILFDLSQSMDATDIRPSRLARAKLELEDILDNRKTGQTALVVYAGDAFVVTPLTDDNDTIKNLVPALDTQIMPSQGSNLSAALAKAFNLFSQAGVVQGNILVMTDDINPSDLPAIKKVASQGHRLSIFGFGTAQGAPIPLAASPESPGEQQGGFLLDNNGAIVIPKLNADKLSRYAADGGGRYISLRADDSDTRAVTRFAENTGLKQSHEEKRGEADLWQDDGYWLILPVMLIAAFWARKGWLAVLMIVLISNPVQPTYADSGETNNPATSHHLLNNLWLTPDQQAMRAFDQGENAKAAKTFTRPDWQASAYYRSGDYAQAADLLKDVNTSDAQYNRANALAKLGQYQQAIKAYDQAIKLNSNNEDAKHNRELVEQALKQQKQQNQQQQGQPQQDQSRQDQSKQDSSSQQSSQNNQDNKQSDQQKSGEQNQQQQEASQQDASQQQSKAGQQQGNKQQDSNKPDGDKDSRQHGENQDADNQSEQNQAGAQEQQDKNAENKSQTAATEQQQREQEDKQLSRRDASQEAEQEQKEKQQYEQDKKNLEHKDSQETPKEVEVNPQDARVNEKKLATKQWLKRIPDDPAGLLRRKFLYQYKNNASRNPTEQPW